MAGKAAEAEYFISRAGAKADKAFANWLAHLIRAQGKTTLLQDEDFEHESFMAQMHDALEGGARVIAILSPDYLKSEYCIKETNGALHGDPNNRKRRLVPFRLRPCAPSGMIGDLPYCDLLPELRAQDVNALAGKILGDLDIATRNFVGVPKLPDGLMIDPPPLVHPRIRLNPLFAGREDLLAKLNALLLDGPAKPAALLNAGGPSLGSNSMAAAKALGGLGGVGKTELAREFGWRNQSAYAGVWWIEAETRDGLLNGLVELGARFNPRIGEEKNREHAARASLEELENRGLAKPWLFIYDNAQDPAAIADWMPRAGAHCLITSRWRDWTGEADALDVDVFPPEVAVDYLCAVARRSEPQDREQAASLANELGYLPLALSHAAAFCRSRNASFKEYLEKLPKRVTEKPDPRSREGKDYPRSVYDTFVLALESVLAGQPELGVPPQPKAEVLMGIMAWLAPDGIPLDIFPESLFSPDELSGLVAALNEAALLTRTRLSDDTPAVSVHRLVQRVIQVRLAGKAVATITAAVAVRLIAEAFPSGDTENGAMDVRSWPRCRLLEPHAIAALAHAPEEGDAHHALLLHQYAAHLYARADYAKAEPLIRRSIRVYEASTGAEHPDVAPGLNILAELLKNRNQFAEAEALSRRALAISEKSFGADHPEVAICLNNLAQLLQVTNRFAEAEPLMRRALSVVENAYGQNHPEFARILLNLAWLLTKTNRFAEAEPPMRHALAISEAAVGENHPNVAVALNNLALLLHEMNRLSEAEPLLRRAQEIDEQSLGADHPNVANRLNNLARLLQNMDRHAEAEPLVRRALAINEKRFGTDHPDVAACLNNLADLLRKTNWHAEAEPLIRRALAIMEKSFGPAHPCVATFLNNLAMFLRETNRHALAEPLLRRALAIGEQSLNDTAIHLNNLAAVLQETDRRAEAEPLFVRALAISEKSFGAEHPTVATCLNNLATFLREANRHAEAEPLLRRALAIKERSFGAEHPDVAIELKELATLLRETTRHSETEPLLRRALRINEKSLGSNHPHVAACLNDLALLLQETNRPYEAEPLMRRALAIKEQNLDADHPNTVITLSNLARLLQYTNWPGEAETLFRRALAICEESIKPNEPLVATLLNNLAFLLKTIKRFEEAESMYRRALSVHEKCLGWDHSTLLAVAGNLKQLLIATNRPAEAEPFMRRALESLTASLGSDHPNTKAVRNDYNMLLKIIGAAEKRSRKRTKRCPGPSQMPRAE